MAMLGIQAPMKLLPENFRASKCFAKGYILFAMRGN
jgi:hypothetical protein